MSIIAVYLSPTSSGVSVSSLVISTSFPSIRAARATDAMRHTGLALRPPLSIDHVAIADHNPRPALDQGRKRGLAPARLDCAQRHCYVNHSPPPGQYSRLVPCGLIHIVDLGGAGLIRDGFILGCDGCRDPIHRPLHGASADRYPQGGRATLLHRAATVPLRARPLPDQGGQPGAIP